MGHGSHSNSRAALTSGGHSCSGLLGCEERSVPARNPIVPAGPLAPGVRSLAADDGVPFGERLCQECFANPAQYLIDFGCECPTCRGLGHYPDPDFIDGDAVSFDPRREFGTLRTYRGRMA